MGPSGRCQQGELGGLQVGLTVTVQLQTILVDREGTEENCTRLTGGWKQQPHKVGVKKTCASSCRAGRPQPGGINGGPGATGRSVAAVGPAIAGPVPQNTTGRPCLRGAFVTGWRRTGSGGQPLTSGQSDTRVLSKPFLWLSGEMSLRPFMVAKVTQPLTILGT